MPASGLAGQPEMCAAAAKIPDTEPRSLLHQPEVTIVQRIGTQARILVEQHKVTRKEPRGHGEIGAEPGCQGVGKVPEQALRERIIAAGDAENAVRRGTDPAPHQGNSAHVGFGVGAGTPQHIRDAQVKSLHQAIRRGRREKPYVIQNMMHVRLRYAAQAGQPPLGQLTAPDAHPGDVDETLLQIPEIHLRLIREYILLD